MHKGLLFTLATATLVCSCIVAYQEKTTMPVTVIDSEAVAFTSTKVGFTTSADGALVQFAPTPDGPWYGAVFVGALSPEEFCPPAIASYWRTNGPEVSATYEAVSPTVVWIDDEGDEIDFNSIVSVSTAADARLEISPDGVTWFPFVTVQAGRVWTGKLFSAFVRTNGPTVTAGFWPAASGGGATGPAGGVLVGTYPNPSGLRGRDSTNAIEATNPGGGPTQALAITRTDGVGALRLEGFTNNAGAGGPAGIRAGGGSTVGGLVTLEGGNGPTGGIAHIGGGVGLIGAGGNVELAGGSSGAAEGGNILLEGGNALTEDNKGYVEIPRSRFVLRPYAAIPLTVVGNTIPSYAATVDVANNTGGGLILTSTPTILPGERDGQLLIVRNAGDDDVTLRGDSIFPGSGLLIGGTGTAALTSGSTAMFSWFAAQNTWVMVSVSINI